MAPKSHKEKDEAEVTCPVCAGVVTLEDPFCPHCGAEFEEEEVEEVVEEEISSVERVPEAPETDEIEPLEKPSKHVGEEPEPLADEIPPEAPLEEPPTEAAPEEPLPAEPEELFEPEEEVGILTAEPTRKGVPQATSTTSLTDLSVIGITLLMLGIIGAVVMLNIRWFWLWVPSIEGNILPYALIGVAIILISFVLFNKMAKDRDAGKAPPHPMLPSIMLSMILFGFTIVVLFILSEPITEALRASSIGMTVIFIVMVVLGLIVYIFGSRARSRASAGAA
jgi:uncharacterized membrane protein YedE/YeeE